MVSGCPFSGDLQWRVASLLLRGEGLCLYSIIDVVLYAFMVSRAQYWALQDHILRGSEIYIMKSDLDQALYDLSSTIPNFDISNVTRKETVSQKLNMF